MDEKVILIAGPTASGKSALALALAERLGGVVINADSMQVYADMRILTARPSPADEAKAPHRLYGHIPASDPYSAARFTVDAAREIAAARAAGQVPIIVGGTGLYFKALLEGLSPVPAIPFEIRARWRQEGERLASETLHRLLAERDPEMARRLAPADTQRIVRALEVREATGTSLADWQRMAATPVLNEADTIRFALRCDRHTLHRRCDSRFIAMIEEGALAEGERMLAAGLEPSLPAMRAIGLRPLMQYLGGDMALEAAVARGQAETRQYVKRQETWARRNYITWSNVFTKENEYLSREIIQFIKR